VPERFTRIALVVALVLLAAFVAEPYVARFFLTETPPARSRRAAT
jgi:hypothetical protein